MSEQPFNSPPRDDDEPVDATIESGEGLQTPDGGAQDGTADANYQPGTGT